MATKRDPTFDTPALATSLAALADAMAAQTRPGRTRPPYLEIALQVAQIRDRLDDLVRYFIHLAREHDDATWDDVARTFGMQHRQAAWRKWGTSND